MYRIGPLFGPSINVYECQSSAFDPLMVEYVERGSSDKGGSGQRRG